MKKWLIVVLLLAELSASAKVKRGSVSETSRTSQNQSVTLPGTVFVSSQYTYAWPTARSCVATPNWTPLPAVSGGANAGIPISATNRAYTCNATTYTSDPNDLFGHDSGLLPYGIGTNRIDDAFSSAAGTCWLNLSPTGYAQINEGTNFLVRTVFRPTTTAGTKNFVHINTSASEYIRLAMGTGLTLTLREGASGNQTLTYTPPLQNWHIVDFVYVSDCNGDSGNPCVYLYTDGQLAVSTSGSFSPPGTEIASNMGDFGAATSVTFGCDTAEAGMFNGTMLFVGISVGSTMTSWFGTTPTQYLARHRQDCQDTGICSTQTTVELDQFGQSLSQGFNSTATDQVIVASNSATARVPSAFLPHGIFVGDRITTTGHTTNTGGQVAVTAVGANTVTYPLTASDGTMADGNGVITLNAAIRSLTQTHNNRECRGNATLPLLIEGTAGGGGAYESSLTQTTEALIGTHGRGEQFVGVERGISDTSIIEDNNDTADGSAATTNYDQWMTWISDCETRVGGQGSTIMRHIVNFDQGEGSGDAPGEDHRRPEWSEYFAGFQESADQQIKGYSGQSEEVTVCFNQTHSFTNNGLSTAGIMQEQLTAHEVLSNGARAYLTGPKYQCHYSDGTHLTGESYDLCSACLFARCDNAVLNGTAWSPTRPTAQTINGNDINLTIYTPTPPLVVDTTNVTDPGSRGFTYFDSDPTASDPTVSSVSVGSCTGNNCPVTVTMSSSPNRAGARIRYANSGTANNGAGATSGARGNLRDSFGDGTANTCANQSNWLVAFDKPITRTFVDDYAWNFDSDGSSGQEECDATDSAGLEAANGSGQTATGLVVDVWIKPVTNGVNDRNIVAKGNNSTHSWSLITETAAAGYWLRFGIEGVANFFEFGTTNCGSPFDDCTSADHTTPGDTGFTLDRWTHAVCSIDLSHGTIATSAVTIASNVATATVLAGHGASAGQCIVTTGHTTNTPGSPNGCVQITSVGATTIVYPLTAADGPLADGVGTIVDNDLKIRCYAQQCDSSGSSPTCSTALTEKRGVSNATMPAAFVNNTQPLRVGGFGSATPGQYYYGGRIGEIAFWYSDAIDDSASTHTHRSYSVNEVRACLETASHLPVDHAQMSAYVYSDGGIYKSCDWPQLRAWYRMGDLSSGTTIENHTWLGLISGVAGSLTCTNNTGTDIVSDSID